MVVCGEDSEGCLEYLPGDEGGFVYVGKVPWDIYGRFPYAELGKTGLLRRIELREAGAGEQVVLYERRNAFGGGESFMCPCCVENFSNRVYLAISGLPLITTLPGYPENLGALFPQDYTQMQEKLNAWKMFATKDEDIIPGFTDTMLPVRPSKGCKMVCGQCPFQGSFAALTRDEFEEELEQVVRTRDSHYFGFANLFDAAFLNCSSLSYLPWAEEGKVSALYAVQRVRAKLGVRSIGGFMDTILSTRALSLENHQALADEGLTSVRWGLESGHSAFSALFDKPFSLEEKTRAYTRFLSAGYREVRPILMMGLGRGMQREDGGSVSNIQALQESVDLITGQEGSDRVVVEISTLQLKKEDPVLEGKETLVISRTECRGKWNVIPYKHRTEEVEEERAFLEALLRKRGVRHRFGYERDALPSGREMAWKYEPLHHATLRVNVC